MLLNFKVNDFKLFEELSFSMEANKAITHLEDNVVTSKKNSVLKSAVIFGPNNSGKSSFIEAIETMKKIVDQGTTKSVTLLPPLSNGSLSEKTSFEISFLIEDNIFVYGFSINISDEKEEKEIVEEYLKKNATYVFRRLGNQIESKKKSYKIISKIFQSKTTLFLNVLGKSENKEYQDVISVLNKFSDITIITPDNEMDRKFRNKSIHYVESGDNNFVTDLMKYSDLSIDDIEIDEKLLEKSNSTDGMPDDFKKYMALKAIHRYGNKGIGVPLFFFESLGTKKLFNLAGEIYSALTEDKILLIDEIDNSFHTVMTRNLFNLFHLSEETKGQLIATTHDLLLLENKYLFRKDQVWFTEKEDGLGYLYSLNDFTAETVSGGIRSGKTNILNKYMHDKFGALPNIDVVTILDNLTKSNYQGESDE